MVDIIESSRLETPRNKFLSKCTNNKAQKFNVSSFKCLNNQNNYFNFFALFRTIFNIISLTLPKSLFKLLKDTHLFVVII